MVNAKTLYLVRHAKSSWKDIDISDRDRPLNRRGNANAPMMGERLAELIYQGDGEFPSPQKIVTSPALRAVSTANQIAVAIGLVPQAILLDERLYFQGTKAMLEVITGQHNMIDSLMLVSHNPNITDLNNLLNPVDANFLPTCAIVTLHFNCESWREVGQKRGCLVNYDYPKKTLDI